MGQDVYGILDYFKGSHTSTLEVVLIIALVILLIGLMVFLALREIRLRRIAADDEEFRKLKRPPRRVIKWREAKGLGTGTARRKAPRLERQFPVNVGTPDGNFLIDADILDISAGGVRMILYNAPILIKDGFELDVTASEPPLDIMGTVKMTVMNARYDSEEGGMIVNGRWMNMDPLVGKALRREVLHQLTILKDEEYFKQQQAEKEKEEAEKEEDSEEEESEKE
jgi:hypothetical protein